MKTIQIRIALPNKAGNQLQIIGSRESIARELRDDVLAFLDSYEISYHGVDMATLLKSLKVFYDE